MKRKVVFLISFVICLIISFFLLNQPAQYREAKTLTCPPESVSRLFLSTNEWKKWWPGNQINDSTFELNGNTYTVKKILVNGFYAVENNQETSIDFSFTPALKNQTDIVVTVSAIQGNTIVNKLSNLFFRKNKKIASKLVNEVGAFFEQTKKVYGIEISKGRVDYINWVNAKRVVNHYPSTEETYRLIDSINSYVTAQQVKILGNPILHIIQLDASAFQLMTALPVENKITENTQFQNKAMAPGFLMKAIVTGGNQTVAKALREMENYVRDNKKQSPAIPFQELITNRLQEADSSKWITQINYPVFN